MKRKWLAIGIILLFLGTCVIPATAQNIGKQLSLRGNWLYVGGSGPGNYTKIQDAINASSDGDTVFVYNGTYLVNIVINKKINLVGENNSNTIIDGNMVVEYVVRVLTDSVNISDFKIINAGDGIQIYSNNNTITKNDLEDNIGFGIAVYSGCNNIIYNNIIRNNAGGVLLHSNCQNNLIKENSIIDNLGHYISNGVELYNSSNNEISDNLIRHSTINILLHWSCENTINNNLIENPLGQGIYVFFMSHYNIISNNTFDNSSIEIEANGNKIICNNFVNYPRYAYFVVHNQFFTPQFNYNKFDRNYWDNWIGLKYTSFSKFPKVIVGSFDRIIRIPVFAFDWHPAQEPYDIPGVS